MLVLLVQMELRLLSSDLALDTRLAPDFIRKQVNANIDDGYPQLNYIAICCAIAKESFPDLHTTLRTAAAVVYRKLSKNIQPDTIEWRRFHTAWMGLATKVKTR